MIGIAVPADDDDSNARAFGPTKTDSDPKGGAGRRGGSAGRT